MKRFAAVLFLCIISAGVWAENDKPSSVDLMIPPVIIEIERSDKQDLSIVIPDYNDLKLPDLGIKLPDPVDITVQKLPPDIPLPSLDTPQQQKKVSFFTDANLGAGLDNQLTGNIKLFRLGSGPQFSILFFHDSLDGYGFRKAGEGYFYRKELFEGTVYGELKAVSYKGKGSLSEKEDGLQGKSPLYVSVVRRFRSASLEMDRAGTPWGWQLNGDVKSAQKVLTGSSPLVFNTLSGTGKGTVRFSSGAFGLSLDGLYQLENIKETGWLSQMLELEINPSYHFPSFDAGAHGGVGYLPGTGFLYPFSLFLRGTAVKKVQFRFEGGRRIRLADNYSLWNSFAFAGNAEGWSEAWYAEGHLLTPLFPGFLVHADVNWEKSSGVVPLPQVSSPDPVTGLFPSVNMDDRESLSIAGGCTFDISTSTELQAEWKGQFMPDKNPLQPEQSISTVLSYEVPGSVFKGSASLVWGFIPLSLPEVGGDLSFKIRKGIFLDIKAEDILPLIFQNDRIEVGPYSGPSGKVTVNIKISL